MQVVKMENVGSKKKPRILLFLLRVAINWTSENFNFC